MQKLKGHAVIMSLLFILSSSQLFAEPTSPDDVPNYVQRALTASSDLFEKYPLKAQSFFPTGYESAHASDEIVTLYRTSLSELRLTRLNSVKNMLIDLGLSLTARKDRRNLRSIYKMVYLTLPKKFKKKVTPYAQVRNLPLKALRTKTLKLMNFVHVNIDLILELIPSSELIIPPFTVNPIAECSQETGAEDAGYESELSERCQIGDYDPDGLFSNVNFPLKDNLTCIKDQGRRGTCVAHAIAATVESLRLKYSSIANNLSEQHIYYTGEVEAESLYSLYDMQTSGLCTGCVLTEYSNEAYPIYYERDWNYNRSSFIGAQTAEPSTATFVYPTSCTSDYSGEACSLYVWQTQTSVQSLGIPIPSAAPTGPQVVETINNYSYLLSDGVGGPLTSIALSTAILLLAGDHPVVLSITSTNALQASTDGYVRYSASDTPRGGHAMEMVGYVPNNQVPAGAPQATESGYFIVKNSWGIDSGDCGFYYLDYGYVRHFLEYISIFDIQ